MTQSKQGEELYRVLEAVALRKQGEELHRVLEAVTQSKEGEGFRGSDTEQTI